MPSREAVLTISPAVSALGIKAAYLIVHQLQNAAADDAFERYKEALCRRLRRDYSGDFVRNDPVLAGFREVRKRVGRSSRRFPTSTDSLIGFLHRHGAIPSISFAVDVYNCVSLETRLTLGAHDLAKIEGDVHLRLVEGDERFIPLGSTVVASPPPGEFGYVDDRHDLLCRLDYRQSDKTRVTLDTRDVFYIIQGNANTPYTDLDAAGSRLVTLLQEYGLPGMSFTLARAVSSDASKGKRPS